MLGVHFVDHFEDLDDENVIIDLENDQSYSHLGGDNRAYTSNQDSSG